MANKALQAAGAANRDVSRAEINPLQDCRDVLHISVFFDGTGNNQEHDGTEKKWSNVGRLYYAMRPDDNQGNHSIYISGVGTPFNGKAVNWLNAADVWREDNLFGLVAGAGGTRRLRQGESTVSEALARALVVRAQAFNSETAKYAAEKSAEGLDELNIVLGKYRLIKVIDMSLFGFSRGASLARAFSNRIIRNCQRSGDALLLHGYPTRQSFLGVFDTVASFGVPSQNARLPFEERDLIVSPYVERCVHFVAAHEVRFSFPVDLIRKNGKLAGDWVENVYPGVHSDVGGGYGPNDQGVDNNYARIPMRDMMEQAIASGVRMVPYDEIRKKTASVFAERFECREETLKDYQSYMASCGAMSGTVENQIKRHLQIFYSANGTMHRNGVQSINQRQRQGSKFKNYGPKGMAWEIDNFRSVVQSNSWLRFGTNAVNGYAQFIKPEEWQLDAWDKPASDGVVKFVSRFIHDSKVDFVGNLEPFSYFSARGVHESTVSIWTGMGNWILSKRDDAGEYLSNTYEAGKRKVVETADRTKTAVTDTVDSARHQAEAAAVAAQRKAEEAARYAQQKLDEATAAAKRTYDATAKAANEAAIAARRQAQEAADYARRQTQAAAKAVEQGYNATIATGRNAAVTAGRTAENAREGAEVMVDRGLNWIKRQAKGAADWFSSDD